MRASSPCAERRIADRRSARIATLTATNSAAGNSAPCSANTCMLASRSVLPVSSVIADCSRPGDRHAAMAGGVAVAVAGRPGRAGFRQAPVGGKSLADLARQQFGVGLRRRADALHRRHRGYPPGSAARRGYRPPRRRGNRPTRRAPRAARRRSGRRSRIPRPRWSGAARSVWRRSFSAIATRSFIRRLSSQSLRCPSCRRANDRPRG